MEKTPIRSPFAGRIMMRRTRLGGIRRDTTPCGSIGLHFAVPSDMQNATLFVLHWDNGQW